jgi:hypothetical protein
MDGASIAPSLAVYFSLTSKVFDINNLRALVRENAAAERHAEPVLTWVLCTMSVR